MKEFNNWILAQFPSGGGEPVMLALASVAAQVPALGGGSGMVSLLTLFRSNIRYLMMLFKD